MAAVMDSLDGRTELVIIHGNLTGRRYVEDILRPHVIPYAGAIGSDFIMVDDNARPHRAGVVDDFLNAESRERMD